MKFYYLAFLIWMLKFIMFISIIFIPVVMYLRDDSRWFAEPFYTAHWFKEL